MATLRVDYSVVENSIKYARKAANEAREYAEQINTKVLIKLNNLTDGQSYNIQNAHTYAKEKIVLLNNKADRLELYAKKLEAFLESVVQLIKKSKIHLVAYSIRHSVSIKASMLVNTVVFISILNV